MDIPFLNSVPSFQQYLSRLKDIDWLNKTSLIVTAILLASIIVGIEHFIFQNFPAWTPRTHWTRHPTTAMRSLFAGYPAAPPRSQDQVEAGRPRAQTCLPLRSLNDSTRRTVLTNDTVTLYAWPSRGGVIILEQASPIDFTFLGLDTLNPPLRRLLDQALEAAFCQQLLLLGAKWWDSESRYRFITQVSMLDSRAITKLEEERAPYPTLRERRWVKVGWPSEPRGGLWVAEFDTNMYDIQEENLVPEDAARVMLARDMDERCEILKRMGARLFGSLGEYEGAAFLKAWEEKTVGEVGPLMETQFTESPVCHKAVEVLWE